MGDPGASTRWWLLIRAAGANLSADENLVGVETPRSLPTLRGRARVVAALLDLRDPIRWLPTTYDSSCVLLHYCMVLILPVPALFGLGEPASSEAQA